jgi:Na+/melibiose symporter-like transporter
MTADDPSRSLWRARDFNIYWLGQTLSGLGDAFAAIALPLLVLQSTGSLHRMGRLSALIGAAHVVAGLASGAIVDRVDRRRLMIACDLGRWAVYTAVPIVWWLRGPSYGLLVVAGSVGALLGNTFQVAAITAVANLVPRARLIDANGRMHGSYAAMFFVGPMLAGEVCQRFGATTAIAIDCASYLVSAASLAFVRARFEAAGAPRERVGLVEGFASGVRFLWAVPTLRALTVLLGLSSLLMAGRENLLIFHIKRNLHGDDRAVGHVFALAALGAVLGAWAAPALRARWGFAACWLGAGLVMGAALLCFGRAGSLALVAGIATAVAFGETVRGINTMTTRQEITPDRLLGRVTAAFWALLTVPGAVGAEATARLAERYGVQPVLASLGAALVALMVVGAVTPIRRPAVSPA